MVREATPEKQAPPPRPVTPPVLFSNIPDELRDRAQWVLWRWTWKEEEEKWDKPPSRLDGRNASSKNPATWSGFEAVMAAYQRGGWDGVGFMFSKDDPFAGLDLDDCRDDATGKFTPWALDFLQRLDSYCEISPSMTGAKVFVKAKHRGEGHKLPHHGGVVEFYDQGRYFTVTGHRLDEYSHLVEERQEQAEWVWVDVVYASPKARAKRKLILQARSSDPPDRTDEWVMERCRSCATGAKFERLWAGGTGDYDDDHSRADCGLCELIHFWSGDLAQVDRLFRRSGLMRDKWTERHYGDGRTYGEGTLDKVKNGKVWQPRAEAAQAGESPVERDGAKPPGVNGHPAAAAPSSGSSGGSVHEWGAPIPLNRLPPAPPFPLERLTGVVGRYAAEVGRAMGCPPDLIAAPALVTAGAMLGRARVLRVKRGYEETASIFLGVVSRPGSAKTPAQEAGFKPARLWDGRQWRQYLKEKSEYEEAVANLPKGEPRPPKPVPSRICVDDITVEALAKVLSQNPRGVALVKDELSGWVLGMDQYRAGGGNEKQRWLSLWSGVSFPVDRRGVDDPVMITDPFVCVVGGLTPSSLRTLRGDRGKQAGPEDGFVDRILLCYPDPVPDTGEDSPEVSVEAERDYVDLMDRIRCVGTGGPMLFTPDGAEAWREFRRGHAAELGDQSFPERLLNVWAKMRTYAARLTLVVHAMRWAATEADNLDAVDAVSVNNAVAILGYFKKHTVRAHSAMGGDDRQFVAERLIRWIKRTGQPHFTRRDCFRGMRSMEVQKPEDLDGPLNLLIGSNYIRERTPTVRQPIGRPPSAVFDVNPALDRTDRTDKSPDEDADG